jgi:long-subunit fatty acid transport protein
MKKIITTILCIIILKQVNAQRPETGQWYTLNLPGNFSKHWQWHNDASYRTLATSFRPLQYLYRTGLRYNFNKQWSSAAGVAFFFTKTDFDKAHHEFGNEFRFWQEVLYSHSLNGKLQLLLRLRTEQRFFASTSKKEKFTGYRFRLRTGINQKLNDKWSLQLTNEYMRQIAHHKFSFDQNRLTFSGIYYFNTTTQLQTGYMWIKWTDASQQILTLSFTKTISLHG